LRRFMQLGILLLLHNTVGPTNSRPSLQKEGPPMAGQNDYLDAVATGVADGTITRGRAIKLAGAALLGSALSLFVAAGEAEASHHSSRRRACTRRGGTYCYGPHTRGVCCGPNWCPSPGQCARGRCGQRCLQDGNGGDDNGG
jgi:hypothetical protein